MKIVWTETKNPQRDITLVGGQGMKVGTGECHPPATVAQNKCDEPELTPSKMVGKREGMRRMQDKSSVENTHTHLLESSIFR